MTSTTPSTTCLAQAYRCRVTSINIKDLIDSGPGFKPVTLKLRLTDEEIANFAIQRPRFPGVDFQPRLVRHYPHGIRCRARCWLRRRIVQRATCTRLVTIALRRYAHTGKTGVESSFRVRFAWQCRLSARRVQCARPANSDRFTQPLRRAARRPVAAPGVRTFT